MMDADSYDPWFGTQPDPSPVTGYVEIGGNGGGTVIPTAGGLPSMLGGLTVQPYQPYVAPLPVTTPTIASNLSTIPGIAQALQIGAIGWDTVVQIGQWAVKGLQAIGISVPAWVLAAVGLAAGVADVLTPGGLVTWNNGFDVGVTGPGVFGSTVPGASLHGGITKHWKTGTTQFVRAADGAYAAMKKDGSWRWYRLPKPIVLSRHPRIDTLVRAEKKLSRWAQSVYRVTTRTTKFRKKGG